MYDGFCIDYCSERTDYTTIPTSIPGLVMTDELNTKLPAWFCQPDSRV